MKIGRSKTNAFFTSRETGAVDNDNFIYPTKDTFVVNNSGLDVRVISGTYPAGTQLRIFGGAGINVGIINTGNVLGDYIGILASANVPIVLTVDAAGNWYQVSDFGPLGNTGPIGTQGATGATGATGTTGTDGLQGPTGAMGIPGGEGPPGNAGDNGGDGMAGNPGNPGNEGGQGFTGPEGNQGIEGPPGTPC